jgi:hypothetical protein
MLPPPPRSTTTQPQTRLLISLHTSSEILVQIRNLKLSAITPQKTQHQIQAPKLRVQKSEKQNPRVFVSKFSEYEKMTSEKKRKKNRATEALIQSYLQNLELKKLATNNLQGPS